MKSLLHPTLRIEETRFAVWRFHGVGHPSLSLREVASLPWRILELEDEVHSCLTLVERRFGSSGWGLGSTYFSMTMIFSRFLQVQFNLDLHAFSWIWRICTEQLLRGDRHSKPESLQLALRSKYGAPTVYLILLSHTVHIEVTFRHHV